MLLWKLVILLLIYQNIGFIQSRNGGAGIAATAKPPPQVAAIIYCDVKANEAPTDRLTKKYCYTLLMH
jgi:hypothetical protein